MKQPNEELKALAAEVAKLSHLAKLQQELIIKLHDAVAAHQKVIEALDGKLQASAGRTQDLRSSLN